MARVSAPVIIVGGGMVGLANAIALAQEGLEVVVIDAFPFVMQQMPEFDGRVCALAHGSVILMQNIGVWPYMKPYAEPIRDIRVIDEHSPISVHYDHREVGNEPMGYIVENRQIRQAMQQRVQELPGIKVLAPAEWSALQHNDYGISLQLRDGALLQGELLIAADGKHSRIREQCGITTLQADYGQTALVATIAHTQPHNGLAMERFFAAGPFAVLPMKHNRSSLVWVERSEDAKLYTQLNRETLERQIRIRVGDYLGDISLQGEVFAYPLTVMLAREFYRSRVALTGDAAHGIHPIAGQGVNLGFRDVAALTEVVLEAARLGQDIASTVVLERYARWRRFDTALMTAMMDGMTRLFSNHHPVLKLVRNIGFAGVEHSPLLKHFFMRHAMGLVGDLPPLMQKSHHQKCAA